MCGEVRFHLFEDLQRGFPFALYDSSLKHCDPSLQSIADIRMGLDSGARSLAFLGALAFVPRSQQRESENLFEISL